MAFGQASAGNPVEVREHVSLLDIGRGMEQLEELAANIFYSQEPLLTFFYGTRPTDPAGNKEGQEEGYLYNLSHQMRTIREILFKIQANNDSIRHAVGIPGGKNEGPVSPAGRR